MLFVILKESVEGKDLFVLGSTDNESINITDSGGAFVLPRSRGCTQRSFLQLHSHENNTPWTRQCETQLYRQILLNGSSSYRVNKYWLLTQIIKIYYLLVGAKCSRYPHAELRIIAMRSSEGGRWCFQRICAVRIYCDWPPISYALVCPANARIS